MFVLFFIILIRLFNLQIINFEENIKLSNYYSQRKIPIAALRGEILDNKGEILATNIESYVLEYSYVNNSDSFFTVMSDVLEILSKHNQELFDNFPIKTRPFRFEFDGLSREDNINKELEFKKTRGYYDKLKSKHFSSKEITDSQKRELENLLLNISAKEVFYDLVKNYGLHKLLNKNEYSSSDSGEVLYDKLVKKYSPEDIRKYVLIKDSIKINGFSGNTSIVLSNNLNRDVAFEIMQKQNVLNGINVSQKFIRYYPEGEFASNIIGYMGVIDDSNKEKYKKEGYNISNDVVGKSGIESVFESNLRGYNGSSVMEVYNNGTKKQDVFEIDAKAGDNIYLTIDKDLQKVTERALSDVMRSLQKTGNKHGTGLDTSNATRGAAVVTDVKTGNILSLVSLPNYDPNVFVSDEKKSSELRGKYFGVNLKEFGEEYIKNRNLEVTLDELFPLIDKEDPNSLRGDPNDIFPKVFFNYATQGLIPPGSTFKPLTAIAALEEGVLKPDELIEDKIIFEAYNNQWKNLNNNSLGKIDVKDALKTSNNYFFYEVGNRLYNKDEYSNSDGLDVLANWAWKFGLGVKPNSTKYISTTNIELIETTGQVFNLESMKSNIIALSPYNVVDILNKGEFGKYKFKPIDITKKSGDSEKLSNLKKEIKDLIKKVLNEDLPLDVDQTVLNEKFNNLFNNLQDLFSQITEYYNIENNTDYTENDVKSMANAISEYTLYSLRTEIYTPGNVINASIGQGINLFTPVQLVNYVATLVNGGYRYKLNLVDKIVDIDNNIVKEYEPEVLEKVNLKKENVDAVIEGMRRVNRTGTNAVVFNHGRAFPIESGGKTGTATFKENGMQEKIGRAAYGVFIGFAPVEDPEIAVSVVLYDGGHGYFGAYVARAIFEAYFKERLQESYPGYIPLFPYAYSLMD